MKKEKSFTPTMEQNAAAKIAAILLRTPTESRGNVLLKVARELSLNTQHYTANLIKAVGEEYNRPRG